MASLVGCVACCLMMLPATALAQLMPEPSGILRPPAPAVTAPSRPQTTESQHVTGEVLTASPRARILVILTDEKQMTFVVPHALTADLDRLHPGQLVTVRYVEGYGNFIAENIS